jgi:hypothetical protein
MDGSDRLHATPFWRGLVTFLLHQPNVWLLLVLQVTFFWYFTCVGIVVSYVAPLLGILGGFSMVALLGLVNLGLSRLRWRPLRILFNGSFILAYALLILYHWRRGASLDFALLATNVRELLSPSGFRALVEVSGWAVGLTLALLVVWTFPLEYFYQGLSRIHPCPRPRVVGPALLAWAITSCACRKSCGPQAIPPCGPRHIPTWASTTWARSCARSASKKPSPWTTSS